MDLFSDEWRRDPYPIYDKFRSTSPVQHFPQIDRWLIFDYEGVKRAVSDHGAFSSNVRAPGSWFIFFDPPRHTPLRALMARAFSPRSVAQLEPRIRSLSRQLLDQTIESGKMDVVADLAGPLPRVFLAQLLGIPVADMPRYMHWCDSILMLNKSPFSGVDQVRALRVFRDVTAEMMAYLPELTAQRRAAPQDDLLTRFVAAEVNGDNMKDEVIVNFVQMLLAGAIDSITSLISSAVLCLIENPDQRGRLLSHMELLPSTVEEVLRFRCPIQAVQRVTKRNVEMHGKVIPAGKVIFAMIGAANRDPKQFRDPNHFDIARDPNPHIAFGHGIHVCLGAALAQLQGRVVLAEFLERVKGFELVSDDPWEPTCKALHVHGPARLPIRFESGKRAAARPDVATARA